MVYIILGKGFEPMEAIAPCDILRRGGAEVRFAGIGGTLIEGGHGISLCRDPVGNRANLGKRSGFGAALRYNRTI